MNTPRITFPTKTLYGGFSYTTAVCTDIRILFARVKEELKKKRKHDSVSKVKA